MGCDIHIATEKKVGDRWVMVTRLDYRQIGVARNYERFTALAGVRGEGPEPRGLPDDISDGVKLYRDEWSGDGHSDSWHTIKDAAQLFLETEYAKITDYMSAYPEGYYFDIELEIYPGEYRVVFWFDN